MRTEATLRWTALMVGLAAFVVGCGSGSANEGSASPSTIGRALSVVDSPVDRPVGSPPDPTGGVDGPVMYKSEPASPPAGEEAGIAGVLQREGDCLYVVSMEGPYERRYPILWRYGTRWSPDAHAVVTPEGTVIRVGDRFSSGGGYWHVEWLDDVASPIVIDRADSCVGTEAREVANIQAPATLDAPAR